MVIIFPTSRFARSKLYTTCLMGGLLWGTVGHHVQAETLRCNQQLVQEGALTFEVLRKCGEPNSRDVMAPAVDPSGHIRHGAVTVEIWVYGPDNGMYRYLRFIDGELVKIWSKPR